MKGTLSVEFFSFFSFLSFFFFNKESNFLLGPLQLPVFKQIYCKEGL